MIERKDPIFVILIALMVCTMMCLQACLPQVASTASPATASPGEAIQPTETTGTGYAIFEQEPFKITFAYPSSWDISVRSFPNSSSLLVQDPSHVRDPSQILTPTVIVLDADLDEGLILVNMKRVDPTTFSLDEHVEANIKLRLIDSDFSLVENKLLSIDGYPARWTVYEVARRFNESASYYEDVFLVIDDQFYRFGLDVPIVDRNGEYGKVFDLMIRSIQVVEK